MVKLAEFLLENATLAEVEPLIVTCELTRAAADVSDAGTTNVTRRIDPNMVTTFWDFTVTGEPFPEGGVIVTETHVGQIVPLGNPLPVTLTVVISGGASPGVVTAFNVIWAEARATPPREKIAKAAARRTWLLKDIESTLVPSIDNAGYV
jgi:hypothetical protein